MSRTGLIKDVLRYIFDVIKKGAWFRDVHQKESETLSKISEKYEKNVKREDWYDLWTKYATMRNQSSTYNTEYNDFQYDLQISIRDVVNRQTDTFDNVYDWEIILERISLKYLNTKQILYFTVQCRVRVFKQTGILLRTDPVDKLNLDQKYNDMQRERNNLLGVYWSGKLKVNMKPVKYAFRELVDGKLIRIGTTTLTNVNVFDSGKKFYLFPEPPVNAAPVDVDDMLKNTPFFTLRVKPVKPLSIFIAQLHEMNLQELNPYVIPEELSGITGTNELVNQSMIKIDTAIFRFATQCQDLTDLYWPSSFNPSNPDFYKARITKVRSMPICKGIENTMMYFPEPRSKWNEPWDLYGKFTLWTLKSNTITYDAFLSKLDEFEKKIVVWIPLYDQWNKIDHKMFELMGKVESKDRESVKDALSNLNLNWKMLVGWITRHITIKSGTPNAIFYFFCNKIWKSIFKMTPHPVFIYLFRQYFNFAEYAEVKSQRVLSNGVYWHTWQRHSVLDGEQSKMEREFVDTIENAVPYMLYDYRYRYVPTNVKHVTPKEATYVYTPPKGSFEHSLRNIFCKVVLVDNRPGIPMKYFKWSDSFSFKVDRTKNPHTIAYKGVEMELPIKIWVMERNMMCFIEKMLFGLSEIENLMIH